MSQIIKLKRSAVTGNIPATSQIDLGELAINTFDGKMFFKMDNGTASIVRVLTSLDSIPTVSALAGNGLVQNGSALDVNVDGSTLEVNTDILRIKDAGVTNTKLTNSNVVVTAGNGLSGGGSVALGATINLDVNVDASTIEINADTLRVKDAGITNAKLTNSSVTVTAGSALTGGGAVALGASTTLNVNTDNTTIEVNTNALRLKDNGTTNAKLAQMPTLTIKGNNTGGTANALDLTATQVKALLAIANTDVSGLGTMSTQNAAAVAITGGTITGLGTPTGGSDAATKSYVDAATSGLAQKASVKVATTAALTATYANGASGVGATLTNSGTQAAITIDAVALAVNDRVLVKNQASTFQNGIYIVTTVGSGATNWVLTRAVDYDQAAEITEGTYTVVSEGTSNKGTLYIMTTTGAITVGTTAVVFTQLTVAPQSLTFTTDVTGTGSTGGTTVLTIANSAVSNAKMANMNNATIKGNNAGSAGAPLDLTATQVKTLLAIAAADVSGLAASATTDTTNASNISSGTLANARGGIGKVTLTQPATGSTLTIADGQTLTVPTSTNVLVISGTSKLTVGTTAPVSPAAGDIWIDTN